MKKISFNSGEANWLTELLLQRISSNGERHRMKAKVSDYCISAMLKLEENTDVMLKDWERTMCSSVVNEFLHSLNEKVKVADAYALINTTDSQKAELAYVDMAKGILKKLDGKKAQANSEYNLNSFYEDKFAVLTKLQRSELIYISRVSEDSVYKIGFVYQGKEASVYELSNRISLDDLNFYVLKADALEYGKRFFSLVTDRKGARDIISNCDKYQYPENQLAFLKLLLN